MKCKKILFVLLKIQGQTHQAAASLETIQVLALFNQGVLRVRTARGIICRYNWIADYTTIIHVNSQNKRGALTMYNNYTY